jgi:hypothetical protein
MSRLARNFLTLWNIFCTLIIVTAVVAVAFVGWQYWLYKGGIFRTSSFNEAEWKSLKRPFDDVSCYRGGMAHDIKTNIPRTGLTKTEVEGLLGEPDFNKAEVHEYNLGFCSGLRIDLDTLDVHFDSEGKLTEVYVVQH